MSSIAELRAIVCNDTLSPATRSAAADHLLQLAIADVRVPSPDDDEVKALCAGWPSDTGTAWLAASFRKVAPKAVDGYPPSEAQQIVRKRFQLRALLSVVATADANRFERLAACDLLLSNFLPPSGIHRRNNYSADRLLSELLPDTATKWISTGKAQVERPPKELADCW